MMEARSNAETKPFTDWRCSLIGDVPAGLALNRHPRRRSGRAVARIVSGNLP
jgi:hypothetical protein